MRQRQCVRCLVPSLCLALAFGACTAAPENTQDNAGEPVMAVGNNGAAGSAAPSSQVQSEPSAPPAAAPPASMPQMVAELPPAPMNFVLEDFADGDGRLSSSGFNGRWRVYSDGTGQV